MRPPDARTHLSLPTVFTSPCKNLNNRKCSCPSLNSITAGVHAHLYKFTRSTRGSLQQVIAAARKGLVQTDHQRIFYSENDKTQQWSPKRKVMLTFAKRTTGSLRAPPTNFSTTPLDPFTNPLLVLRVRINMTCAPSFNSTIPRACTHITTSA